MRAQVNPTAVKLLTHQILAMEPIRFIRKQNKGVLAEYIVKVAIGDNSTQRTEWDNYDLISNNVFRFLQTKYDKG